ncbi:hypothetical protein [Amycolatopsis plumensis]|uniref:Uncharacterized protein n=1 Tax=Amycolatopsis plumensis TaxID=236508 RepID=A0ABV5TZB7_9PSEU
MTGFLTEVGKRLGTRWVTAILLPGLLLVAVVVAASVLGHEHAFGYARLAAAADRAGREFTTRPARLAVFAAVVLAAAGLAGTTAGGLGGLVQRWCLRDRFVTGGLLRRSRWSRRSRAVAAAERAGATVVPAYLPQRPTWLGDRARLIEVRVRAQYYVSASLVWPRLWLLLEEDARRPITDVRTRYAEAGTLAGWGLLYLVPGVLWWPALLIAAGVLLTAWSRLRATMAEFAELAEAAIDLRLRDLAAKLGLTLGTEVGPAEGRTLDDLLGKAG